MSESTSEQRSEVELASRLAGVWQLGMPFAELPGDLVPQDEAAAYAVQRELLRCRGQGVGGWKVGAKSPTGPIQGSPLPADCVFTRTARFPFDAPRRLGMELEIGFVFGRSFVPGASPYAEHEVLAGISHVVATIELVASRFHEWPAVDKLAQLADLQNHGALVIGEFAQYDPAMSVAGLPVSLRLGDDELADGRASNPAGDPRRLLPWLVNHACALGYGLHSGTVVTCGSYTGLSVVRHAGRVVGRIAGLPAVTCEFAD
jgi:2-keto-4-pentenoate hydratase